MILYTDMTEGGTDAGTYSTVTGQTLAIADIPHSAQTWFSADQGAGTIEDFRLRCVLNVSGDTSSSGAGPLVLGVGNTAGTVEDFLTSTDTIGVLLVGSSTNFALRLFDFGDNSQDDATGLSFDTDYYLEFTRTGTGASCTIRTGGWGGSLVDTISTTVAATTYQYVLGFAARGSALTPTSSLSVSQLHGIAEVDRSYSSTIDAINDLKSKLWFDPMSTQGSEPLAVCMHGFSGNMSAFDSEVGPRWVGQGVGCLMVEMRGRGSAGGSEDAGGREIYDIIDAIDDVDANYSLFTATDAHIVGYSGGGGNALSVAARFPDRVGVAVSFFGISDYGFDETDGWYGNGASAGQIALLESWVGDTPANALERYKARAAVLAITNYSGRLRLFHDSEDVSVPVVNSENVVTARPHTVGDFTGPLDSPRWTHGVPNAGAPTIEAESIFMPEVVSGLYAPPTMTGDQTLVVIGYVVLAGWEVWFGDGTADYGTVGYIDGEIPSFTLTQDEATAWTVKRKGLTSGQIAHSRVNGVHYFETVDSDGVATFTSGSSLADPAQSMYLGTVAGATTAPASGPLAFPL